MSGAAKPRGTDSYYEIVKAQFRKNTPAVWSLWTLVAIFFLATYAPLIALDVPFTTDLEGVVAKPWVFGLDVASPWLLSLIDPAVFPLPVDIFFNLLMFTLPVVIALAMFFRGPARRALIVLWAIGHLVGFGYVNSIKEEHRQPPHDWVQEVYEAKADAFWPLFKHGPGSQRTEFNLTPIFSRGTLRPGAEEPAKELWPFYVLGSDNLGNDVLTRVLYGTRISLTIGIVAVALYVTVGIFLGGLAGYFGGWVDDALLFCAQVVMTIPGLFLILFILSILPDPNIFHIMGIIAMLSWPNVMRLVRGEFLRQRAIDYVAASKALGFSDMRIMFRHIAPNSMAPVFVSATFGVAGAILIESTISFLGFGDPAAASWGQLLKVGGENASSGRHLVWTAGGAIFLIVLILNLIGEGLRDALDPKLRK